ncbi:EVE domain-containing protein [Ectobacillus sp. JY-23]|uniref:HNH endonuclease n=1 Tax=Ectobacillus sp. JY-23 TaxID=2933872 RepID=UPI001FF34FFC|nr:HNH endonuclease [Ectobacillus sp. JY-23]UOY93151.1 EVE domain-containing protein [Ectobacillus sp. JY-23]
MDVDKYNKSFANQEYVKGRGEETEYYIITAKLGDRRYKLTLLRNHSIIEESYHEGLTAAKNSAFEWLISHDPLIFKLNKATMVHYKEDRPNGNVWVKDTNVELHRNLEAYLKVNNIELKNGTFKNVEVSQGQQTWIFQGNPSIFDINNYISNHKYIWWSLRQEYFADKIQINDNVFLWRSDGGKRGTGGIIAACRIVSLPLEKADDSDAQEYWYTDDWKNAYLAVKLEVLEVRIGAEFISRLSLLEHPILKELLILRLRQQTNYLLSKKHAIELQGLWESKNSFHDELRNQVSSDIEASINLEITDTEKERVIKSRIGQSVFKKALLTREKKCGLCGVSDEQFLVASHIKPWSQSSNQERLDVNNGLLLCPNHDALFDKGYISFGDDGGILISESLNEATKVFLNINEDMRINISESQRQYMNWHCDNVFKANYK